MVAELLPHLLCAIYIPEFIACLEYKSGKLNLFIFPAQGTRQTDGNGHKNYLREMLRIKNMRCSRSNFGRLTTNFLIELSLLGTVF